MQRVREKGRQTDGSTHLFTDKWIDLDTGMETREQTKKKNSQADTQESH